MKTQTRHVRGPIVVGAFVLLASAGVVGGYLSLQDYPKPAEIVDIVNIDGDRAVVIRSVNGPDDRSFTSLFERKKGERWGAMIPKYRVPSPARAAVTATGDVVFVRSDASGQWAFFAFDADEGQKLGRIEPFERRTTGPGAGLARAGTLSSQGWAYEFGGDDGAWAVVLAFDLTTGTLAWQQELGAVTIQRAWLRPAHIVLATADELMIIDRTKGAILTRLAVRGQPCVSTDTAFFNGGANTADDRAADGRTGLFALALPADSTRPLAPPMALGKDAPLSRVEVRGLCGYWPGSAEGGADSHHLLAVRDHQGQALIALDKALQTVRWRLPMADAWQVGDIASHTPDRVPLSGAVGRYVPVQIGTQIAMLDVVAGRVAWHTDNPAAVAGVRLMSAAGALYLYRPEGDVLAVFDNRTGRLRAARSLDGFGPVWPRQIAGGTIWLGRDRTLATLDARTLEPLQSHGTSEVGDDIRANFTAQLGIVFDPPAR